MTMAIRCAALFALVLIAGCATRNPTQTESATPATPQVEVVTHIDEFALAGVARVRVVNRHGDVRLRFGDRGTANLHATIQRIGERPLDPEFRVVRDGESWTLDVRYRGDEHWSGPGHSRGRVDFGLWLPQGVAVDVETTDGTVQIRRAKGAIRVRTDSGAIQASGQADLDIESASGEIIARQESGNWQQTARVVSGSGRILAAIPAFADVHLRASSGGVLSVDPGLPAPMVEGDRMRIDARLGAALRMLEIRSNADVHLVPVLRVDVREQEPRLR